MGAKNYSQLSTYHQSKSLPPSVIAKRMAAVSEYGIFITEKIIFEQPAFSVDSTHRVFLLVVVKLSIHNWYLISLFNIATLVSPPVTFPQNLVMSQ